MQQGRGERDRYRERKRVGRGGGTSALCFRYWCLENKMVDIMPQSNTGTSREKRGNRLVFRAPTLEK